MARKFQSLKDVPPHILEKLGNYVTNVGGDTFVITGLPPELTGGLLARYSRAPTGLQLTLVNEFLDENGDPNPVAGSELMDRVLNAFGDESVGELEGASVGIEDVSQLLTKEIEDRRIGGSPIEQSTRYVVYDKKDPDGNWRYLRPREIMESGLGEKFEEVNDRAFEVYTESVDLLKDFFRREFPRDQFTIEVERGGERIMVRESELQGKGEERAFRSAYNFTIKCAALDVGRGVLPSSTLTHLGNVGNGRFNTGLITHLKSSELYEGRERGLKLEVEENKVIPTYIKRNRVDGRLVEINRNMRIIAEELFREITPTADRVTLVTRDDLLNEVVSYSLFPYSNISLQQIQDIVKRLPHEKKLDILDIYKGSRETRRDRTGRGLEAGYPVTFDLVGGFAEYRDLERHRMLTQQRQMLTTDLGFIMPPEIGIVGLEEKVEEVAYMMADLNSDLRHTGLNVASQYATLFNNRMRFAMGMNHREFQHLSELRTQPAGHFSYRAMVIEMTYKLLKRDLWAETLYEFIDRSDPGNKISRAAEQSRIAGKNLVSGIEGDVDYA